MGQVKCTDCYASGYKLGTTGKDQRDLCQTCNGTGYVYESQIIEKPSGNGGCLLTMILIGVFTTFILL